MKCEHEFLGKCKSPDAGTKRCPYALPRKNQRKCVAFEPYEHIHDSNFPHPVADKKCKHVIGWECHYPDNGFASCPYFMNHKNPKKCLYFKPEVKKNV